MAKAKFPTKKQFRIELNRRGTPAQFEVGDSEQCALAYAYRSITGKSGAEIGNSEYYPEGFLGEAEPLPKWATKFVKKFDEGNGTRKEARKLLK